MAVVDRLKEIVDLLIAAALIKQGTYAFNLCWLLKRVFIAPIQDAPIVLDYLKVASPL